MHMHNAVWTVEHWHTWAWICMSIAWHGADMTVYVQRCTVLSVGQVCAMACLLACGNIMHVYDSCVKILPKTPKNQEIYFENIRKCPYNSWNSNMITTGISTACLLFSVNWLLITHLWCQIKSVLLIIRFTFSQSQPKAIFANRRRIHTLRAYSEICTYRQAYV